MAKLSELGKKLLRIRLDKVARDNDMKFVYKTIPATANTDETIQLTDDVYVTFEPNGSFYLSVAPCYGNITFYPSRWNIESLLKDVRHWIKHRK